MRTGRKIICMLLIVAVIAAAVGVLMNMYDSSGETVSLELYFLNDSATTIVAEKRDIGFEDVSQLPDKVLETLRSGPSDSKNTMVMAKSVTWSVTANGAKLLVDFSQDFLTTDDTKNLLATYAVVKSLCQINGVASVKVMVEGGELIAPDNSRIGYLTARDINLESDSHTSETRAIKLYFTDEKGQLSAEYRTVKVTDTIPLGQYVVSELIKGPEKEGLTAVLASDTKLISVEITDGTAYVNMMQNFIDKNSGAPEKERLAVYSIVNSVTALDGVSNVQFLIDGKKTRGFSGVDLTMLLTADELLVKKK